MKLLALFAVLTLGVAVLRGEDKPMTLAQAKAKFEKTDAELNNAYKAAIAELDKTKVAELREDERAWITYRDDMAEGMPSFNTGQEVDEPEKTLDYWEAKASFTRDRIEFLKAYSGRTVPAGFTGIYSDSYGGDMEMEETKGGIKFHLTVVRGHAHNIGEISGVAARREDKAYFKQKLDEGDEGPACELVFTLTGGHIVKIEEKVRDPEAGNGVHYDGTYYKIGKIKKPDAEPAAAPQAAATPSPAPSATPAEKPALEQAPKQFFVDARMNTNGPTPEQARKKFDAVDALLNNAYKEACAELDKAKVAELRAKQRDWLSYRDMMAESAPFFNSGDQTDTPKKTADYWVTMTDMTNDRIEFLRAYPGKKVPQGLTGEYSDSYGGTLELEEKKSGVAFSIDTVRSRARNTGEIEGVAQRNGDRLVFKDKPAAGDDRAPCEITFTLSEGHIVKVEEKNGDFYHGFNANFDGVYYKTGKMKGL